MASNYEQLFLKLLPRYLRGSWGQKVATIIGGAADKILQGVKQANKAGLIDHCPEDAVDYHGRARMLERLDGETTEAYRLRVKDAWSFWSTLGTREGLQDSLRLYTGVNSIVVKDVVHDHYQDMVDGDDSNWSRLWVGVPVPNPWAPSSVGPWLVVGPQTLVGITMTANELSRIRRIFRQHRPGHCIGVDVLVAFNSGPDFDTPASLPADITAGDLVAIPLHRALVGYEHHGMTVGQGLIVGQEFT